MIKDTLLLALAVQAKKKKLSDIPAALRGTVRALASIPEADLKQMGKDAIAPAKKAPARVTAGFVNGNHTRRARSI